MFLMKISTNMHERDAVMDANILKYQAFIKTVEYGSFTQAAQALNY